MSGKTCKPSVNPKAGLDGKPGDGVAFFADNKINVGIIDTVGDDSDKDPRYLILVIESESADGLVEGYRIAVSKKSCVILYRD